MVVVILSVKISLNKMYGVFFKNIVLYSVLLTSCGSPANLEDDMRKDQKVTRQYKMRCTRRYSPGVCADYVSSVWTFVFHEQNCTERLGCANNYRANRFKSYRICMKQCQGLVDVYLQMLETAPNINQSVPLRKGEGEPSRVNITDSEIGKQDYDVLTQGELEDLAYDDYGQGENEIHSLVYKDLFNNEDIFPPDVDRVDGEIRSQYDLLHP